MMNLISIMTHIDDVGDAMIKYHSKGFMVVSLMGFKMKLSSFTMMGYIV